MNVIVFLIITVIAAWIFHAHLKKFFIACLLSGLVASTLYQVIGFILFGYLDPFFLIAWIVGFIIATGISALIGIRVQTIKKRKNSAEQAGPGYPPQGVGSPDP